MGKAKVIKDFLEQSSRDLPFLLDSLFGSRSPLGNLMEEFEFHLDYTEESLEALENLINSIFPVKQAPEPTTVIPFALYLGEVLVRNLTDAKWEVEDGTEDIFDVKVTFLQGTSEGRCEVFPFQRVYNFWLDREYNFTSFFRMANMMNLNFLEHKMKKENEWIALPNGDMFRFRTGTEEEIEKLKKK